MRKINEVGDAPSLLDEYDLNKLKGVRGRYAGRSVNHSFTIQLTREDSGRWLAEIAAFGVQAEEPTREEAISKAQGLAFRVLADRIEQGKTLMGPSTISFSVTGRD